MATFTLGTKFVLDETTGLQVGTNGDADVTSTTLPTRFKTFLDALDSSYQTFAALVGVGHSASNVIQVSATGSVTELVLRDANNGTLDGDPAIDSNGNNVLTLDGNQVFLYATSDPHIVIGREGTGTTANAAGDVVLAVYLESNATNTQASLWSVLYEPLQHGDTGSIDEVIDLGNSIKIGAPGDLVLNLGTLASGQLRFGSFGDPKDADADPENAVIVIARDLTTTDGDGVDTVNTSKGGGKITIGVSNQMFDPGEGAYFTFVTGMTGTFDSKGNATLPSAGSNEAGGDSKIAYDDLYGSSGASFTIVQIQGGGNDPRTNITISGFLETASDPQGTEFVTELGNDTAVKILASSVTVTVGGAAATGWTATQSGNSVVLTGVPVGATVRYQTVDGSNDPALHNRVLIENANGNPFDIGGFAIVGPPNYTAIGHLIGFGDDGPAAAIGLTGNGLTVDESTGLPANDGGLAAPSDDDGKNPSLVTAADLIGYASAQLFNTNGSSTGNDGGTMSVSLALNPLNNDSGLKTTDGVAILLYNEGGVIVGRAGEGGPAIFAIGLDTSTLALTLEQYDSVRHPNGAGVDDLAAIAADRVFAVVSVSDGDSDPASQSVDIGTAIGFEDDAPVATLTLKITSLTVDESVGLDAADPNAADEAATADPTDIGYVAILGTDLFTKTSDVGEDDEGAISQFSLAIKNVATALRVSTTNSLITLVQDGSTAVNGMADGEVIFRITIGATSGDVTFTQFFAIEHGDTTSVDELVASLGSGLLYAVWTVTDGDGDKAAPEVDLGALIRIEDDGPSIVVGSAEDLLVDNAVGATDSGSIDFDTGSDATASWTITDAPDSNGFTWAVRDLDGDGVAEPNEIVGKLNGTDFYSLVVNADGTYDFTLLSTLKGSNLFLDVKDIKAGGPDTNYIDVGTLNSDDFVRISGYFDADGSGPNPRAPAAVNESNANVGVVNGNLDANETLTFSLYGADGPDADALPDIQDISGITIGTKTPKATHYVYTAYDDGEAVAGMTNVAITVGKNGAIVIDAPSGVFFDTIEILSVDGNAVKIGLADISIRRLPPDYQLDFTVQLAEADSDTASTSFQVGIDGDGNGTIDNPVMALTPLGTSAFAGSYTMEYIKFGEVEAQYLI